MSKRNTLGFADNLVRQVKQMAPQPSTADMLKLNAPQSMPLNPAQFPMPLQRAAKPMPLVQPELKPLNPNIKLRGDL
jgi:hypothetical protein